MSKSRSSALAAGLLCAVFLAASACGDIGDPNYAGPTGAVLNQVDLDNAPFCVGSCAPDYGSQRIDCRAEDGLEFFPVDVLNANGPEVTQFYAYNDNTADFMVAGPNGFNPRNIVTNDSSLMVGVATNYQPAPVTVRDRCGPDGRPGGMESVHHIRGGLFTEWGGGMGRRLLDFVSSAPVPCPPGAPSGPNDPDYCPDADERIQSIGDAAIRDEFYSMTADLRGWEGISFWARQGPDNTAGIRVYIGDRQLDEDISFLEYQGGLVPMCGRSRECGCRNHRPCTLNDDADGGYSCWDPALDPSPATLRAQQGGAYVNPYDLCGTTLCDLPNPAFPGIPDMQFFTPANADDPGNSLCQLYKLTSDLETYYCFDENEPRSLPPDGPEQCGDGWAKGVALSTDWQFYKVPFTELRQEGYGKEFAYLDLSKLTLVRFTWMQGWVDVWLDDVRFYRHVASASNP